MTMKESKSLMQEPRMPSTILNVKINVLRLISGSRCKREINVSVRVYNIFLLRLEPPTMENLGCTTLEPEETKIGT